MQSIINLAYALAVSMLINLAVVITPVPADVPPESHQTIEQTNPIETADVSADVYGEVFNSSITFPDGDVYMAHKVDFSKTIQRDDVWTLTLPGTSGTVKYYDEKTGWQTISLDGTLPNALLHIETDAGAMLLNPAHMYKRTGTSLESQSKLERPIAVSYENGQFTFHLTFPYKLQYEGHSWALVSQNPLISWTPTMESLWQVYGKLDDQRWTYDGYYYKTPTSYTPYSSTMFWRNPGAYLPRAFTLTGGSRAADKMSYAMLDRMLDYQTKEGYWLSEPESSWLKSDYDIGAGFYDTRFNADTTETYFAGYRKFQEPRFLDAALRQLDWFSRYASDNHYAVKAADGREGWLVYDYTSPGHEYAVKPALCALNHQLQEIQTLLLAYELTGNNDFLALSEKLTDGIRFTRDRWLKADGSLHYAYLPDGSMGKADYPYLTYNNLYDLQNQRDRLGIDRDPDLQVLLESKRAQMERDGITGYRQ